MGRAVSRAAILVAIGLGVLVAGIFVLSRTSVGRSAARELLEWDGTRSSRGTVRIGRVRALPPGPLSLTDYRLVAPDGEVVLQVDEVVATPRWRGLLSGELVFGPVRMVRPQVRLTAGPGGQVKLVRTSEVPDDVRALPRRFEDIRLVDATIVVDLPGKPAVTMRRVHGAASLRAGRVFEWRFHDNRGEIDLPLVSPGFSRMNGRLRSDHAHPLLVRMVVHAGIAEPGIAMDYHVPALAGREGEPYFDLDPFEDVEGSGADATEAQEEARDDLAEAVEERREIERALREARAAGDRSAIEQLRAELRRREREERSARRAAERLAP